MKKLISLLLILPSFQILFAQKINDKADKWADSVFNTLTNDQRIAQLMILRESSFSKEGPVYYDSLIKDAIDKYNIGGICLFQGTPVKQAELLNSFQSMAKTPLMVCIDAEWGLGMRFDSVQPLNHQMMLGAASDSELVVQYGSLIGRQLKRMGIQVDYAPVVDINNNPNNPVINDRSFGENKYKVASYGLAYMNGLEEEGIMATAKHFPGHGDVNVDSHLDLPVINKPMAELDTLELYPFKRMIAGGVPSIMIAHLFIPAIDSTPHTATSISRPAVTGLLRDKLHFNGLTFTDALEMKGVAKYFPGGTIDVQSLLAGNDMLCLPASVPDAISAINDAISEGKLSWNDIYEKCKKVLRYKYLYGVANQQPIFLDNLTSDLNAGISAFKREVARHAITLLNNQDKAFFPLTQDKNQRIAYVGFGIDSTNVFARDLKNNLNTGNFFFDYNADARRIPSTVELLKRLFDLVIIGLHNYHRYPKNQFGISNEALQMIHDISQNNKTLIVDFGNPYAIQYLCDARNLIACYEDDSLTQSVAVNMILGREGYRGTLPVTVCERYPSGSGIITQGELLPKVKPEDVGMDAQKLTAIDSIAKAGVEAQAYPGCVVLAARDGKIFYEKAFGKYNYDTPERMNTETIFDLASVTKILATTISVMKLYDEGKIRLDKTLGTYLPWVRKSDKKNLKIKDILLHQAGLVAFIPFYKKLIDPETGEPLLQYFRREKSDSFSIHVAQHLYLRTDYEDSLYQIILDSKLGPTEKYIYSDNDFIFMGKIVQAVSGLRLDQYAAQNFYIPMGLHSTGFLPREKI